MIRKAMFVGVVAVLAAGGAEACGGGGSAFREEMAKLLDDAGMHDNNPVRTGKMQMAGVAFTLENAGEVMALHGGDISVISAKYFFGAAKGVGSTLARAGSVFSYVFTMPQMAIVDVELAMPGATLQIVEGAKAVKKTASEEATGTPQTWGDAFGIEAIRAAERMKSE